MMPMRRRTSSAVIDATPRAGGSCCCAAAGPATSASTRVQPRRVMCGLERLGPKPNPPEREEPRSGTVAPRVSRLAPLELGLRPSVVPRGLGGRCGARLDARLRAGRGALGPRLRAWLGARLWAWLGTRRRRVAPRLRARRGSVGAARLLGAVTARTLVRGRRSVGTDPAIGLLVPHRLIRPRGVIRALVGPALAMMVATLTACIGPLVGPALATGVATLIACIGPLVGPALATGVATLIACIGPLVGPAALAVVSDLVAPGFVVAAAARDRALAVPNAGWWDDADAPDISTAHAFVAPPGVAGHGTLAHPRDEGVGALTVFEDEARLWPQRPREHHAAVPVRPIGVVVRIVEHDDPEADAGVVVRAPRRVAHVRMAIIAQEAGIVVVLLHVIGRNVVVPRAVAVGHHALRQVRDRHIGVPVHATVRDHAVIPMVVALEPVVAEGVGRGDGEDVADAGIVVDGECVAVGLALNLVVPGAAHEVVFPGLAREQDAHPAVGIDANDGDVGVLLGAEVHADALAARIRILAPVRPHLDAGTIGVGGQDAAPAPGRSGQQTHQSERGPHRDLRCLREQAPCQAGDRGPVSQLPVRAQVASIGVGITHPELSSTPDTWPVITFPRAHAHRAAH